MTAIPSGHIAQLPSGSYRVEVNLGTDPITRRRIRLRETCKDRVSAQITHGKLLGQAQSGKEPESGSALATVGLELAPDAYLFSNDPMHAVPWNPDWASHKVNDLADAAGVELNIKTLRHYTASQLLAARFDLQNNAARLGHGGGGATTLKHYDPTDGMRRGGRDAMSPA